MKLKFNIGFICSLCKFKIIHDTLCHADRPTVYITLSEICWDHLYNNNLDAEYKVFWSLTDHGTFYINDLYKL